MEEVLLEDPPYPVLDPDIVSVLVSLVVPDPVEVPVLDPEDVSVIVEVLELSFFEFGASTTVLEASIEGFLTPVITLKS